MKTPLVAFVAFVLTFQVADGKPVPKNNPNRKSDAENLQGDWLRISLQRNGQEVPSKSKYVLTIKADKWSMLSVNNDKEPISFKVDATKTPKEIDLLDLDGMVIPGIYKLDGDFFTMCLGTGTELLRPTKFATDKGEIIYVWQRAKK